MKKKLAAGIGLCMGAFASLFAMMPSSHEADAAVLVHDEENIAQAVQEVLQTAEILTNEQQQLLLMILNTKSLDASKLLSLLQKQQAAAGGCFGTGSVNMTPAQLASLGKSTGLLNKHTTTTSVLESEIGTIEGCFGGSVSAADLFKQTQKTRKALDATYKEAAEAAKAVQDADEKLVLTVDNAVEEANNAEGTKQVQQAAVAVAAAQAYETRNGNHLLANILAVAVDDAYARNMERAMKAKQENEARENFANFME